MASAGAGVGTAGSPDLRRGDEDGDYFVMQAGGVMQCFESSYGVLIVFGCDVDGDRRDEIVIEDGIGPGTFVYCRRLTILKLIDKIWRKVLVEWLGGYLRNDPGLDPLAWQRRYVFRNAESNRYDLAIALIPPARMPKVSNSPEDLAPLQCPRFVMRYDPKRKSFTLRQDPAGSPPATGSRPAADRVSTPARGREP